MLETFPVILLISTALGFLSGLGVGGGSLLVLWLTAILSMEPMAARGINLLFFIPSALISCVQHFRHKTLIIKPLIPAILAGCIAASIFSRLAAVIDAQILKKAFGVVLLAAGLRELFYRPRNAR